MNYSSEIVNRLRVSDNLREILRVLKKVFRMGTRITIWQNVDGKRIVGNAYIEKINKVERCIHLRPFGQKDFSFHKNFTVYIHGIEQSLLFKSVARYNSEKMITLPIPLNIRLIEKRAEQRISIRGKVHNEIEFEKFKGFNDKAFAHRFIGIDISATGFSFIAFAPDLPNLTVGNSIFLKEVSGVNKAEKVSGKIVYIKAMEKKSHYATTNTFRVGVEFETRLDESFLDEIMDII